MKYLPMHYKKCNTKLLVPMPGNCDNVSVHRSRIIFIILTKIAHYDTWMLNSISKQKRKSSVYLKKILQFDLSVLNFSVWTMFTWKYTLFKTEALVEHSDLKRTRKCSLAYCLAMKALNTWPWFGTLQRCVFVNLCCFALY